MKARRLKRPRVQPGDEVKRRLSSILNEQQDSSQPQNATGFLSKWEKPAINQPSGKIRRLEIVKQRSDKSAESRQGAGFDAPLKEPQLLVDVHEAQGLKILHREIKGQSHQKQLPQHDRQDYEYKLRQIATAGVVRLFNALDASRKAAESEGEARALEALDKVEERKAILSKDAFLSALRQTTV